MNQISSYELNETLACGMFNYNLKFCIPVSIFVINNYNLDKCTNNNICHSSK